MKIDSTPGEDLPPLPEPPSYEAKHDEAPWGDHYSADQMRAYALAERERCARIVEDWHYIMEDREGRELCAAAIRASR